MTIEQSPRGVTVTAGRSLFFDLVRGVASQMVLVGHSLNMVFPSFFMARQADGSLTARAGLFYAQNLGVLLFFLLSGFLVTASMVRGVDRGSYGLAHFLADRFARIFTPLVPLLLIVLVLDHMFLRAVPGSPFSMMHVGWHDFALNAAMLGGNPALSFVAERTGLEWLAVTSPGSAEQLWTVIVEWWIYVFFGILYLLLAAHARPRGLAILAWGGLLAIATSVMLGALLNFAGLLVAWAVGMATCLMRERIDQLPQSGTFAIGSLAFAGALALLLANRWDFYDPLATLLLGVAFYAGYLAIDRFAAIADSRIAVGVVHHMSNVSYSLYLVHFSLIVWLMGLFPALQGLAGGMAVLFLIANLAAWLFYLAFERHYRWVRNRIQPLVDRISGAEPRMLPVSPHAVCGSNHG